MSCDVVIWAIKVTIKMNVYIQLSLKYVVDLWVCVLKYVSKRYKWKFGIKYATYCFFYLNIIYIFVAKIEQY